MTTSEIGIASARFPEDGDVVRELFAEYADSLGIDLSFQGFTAELAELPGKYAPPLGDILIARGIAGLPLGCVALRPAVMPGAGEIKRLYLRPAARGQALGRRLAEAAITRARELGHARVVLDTLATMDTARHLYAALGFLPVPPYYDNPLPGTLYMALELG
ncbi:GNAT family N-acetyltransferase [Rhodanobacter sp. 7MK24]|uniref:GNAT family N-acetyltransferase n=1 Tax=Rhodanobacter sp. 7MK24 TaxID=2775922 RepID=UPI001780A733|nr:GNAT family N-acetyltransferase [Rhodanobacter sp. 7MK24]MBD8880438.1 GNAT family N-acetyltransferase [Rhodanobacter sp. 7MK24]